MPIFGSTIFVFYTIYSILSFFNQNIQRNREKSIKKRKERRDNITLYKTFVNLHLKKRKAVSLDYQSLTLNLIL